MSPTKEEIWGADTVVKKHCSALLRGAVERVKALSDLRHQLEKGELTERFTSDILRKFLTAQFGIGSGVIVNQAGEESTQTDIVVYDNRILPPFVLEHEKGLFPAESVLATIEVKTSLDRIGDVQEADANARDLHDRIYATDCSIYKDLHFFRPYCAVVGFRGEEIGTLREENPGRTWLQANIRALSAICQVGRRSWIRTDGWSMLAANTETVEETKRFLAVMLDNVRTASNERAIYFSQPQHMDLLGAYLRIQ